MSQTDDVLAPENPAQEDYYFVLTDAGAALEAAAHAKGKPLRLTHMAVGDGDGEVPHPSQNATALVNEVYRREIDGSRVDEDDSKICWLHMVIPADVGGFWIREFGVYAEPLEEDGEPVLYAYGNHAPYYKMLPEAGQTVTHEIIVPITQSSNAAMTIVVSDQGYATRCELDALRDLVGANPGQFAALAQSVLNISNRLTQLELAQIAGSSPGQSLIQIMPPEGYKLGDCTVAPVTLVPDGAQPPAAAAFVVETETKPINP